MLVLDNVQDGEDIYQRCLLLTGHCTDAPEYTHLTITTLTDSNKTIFPDQQWPMHHGHFKALVLLNPGNNKITLHTSNNDPLTLTLRHIPLLQTPPLHLAILIAKDSPLLIDCPPSKFGPYSSAHSSLPAAIAKFRLTALMWQALTAEDFRLSGLSRRAFRLEEEYAPSTLSRSHHQAPHPPLQSLPKIHLVRTEHTVSSLRDAQRAQQNPHAKDANSLHEIFSSALKAHGAPFSSGHPVTVAGLILDAHFSAEQNLLLAHAALGAHDPNGLSLGIFGSHLTYAWPRFVEEVSDCLTDTTAPGGTVANDNGECGTSWEACAVGQGAFLHEVGHAYGAPHTSGIMERGAHEGFALPGDGEVSRGEVGIEVEDGEGGELGVRVRCEAGIAVVRLNGVEEGVASVREPVREVRYSVAELEKRFDAKKGLELLAVGMNGKERKTDVWKLVNSTSWLRVPGTNIRLLKKAVGTEESEGWQWAVLLKKKGKHGNLVDASKIDVRVGCGLDGAVVYYKDGTRVPCGPRGAHGNDPHMGGHQAKKIAIRKGVEVVKVAVNEGGGWLSGLRIWLSDGNARGAINGKGDGVRVLVPDEGHRIIGFYGTSGTYGMCQKFGIITAPKDVEPPDSIHDTEELQNNPPGRRSKKRKLSMEEHSETEDDTPSTSEDEDDGYDNASDVDEMSD
ncbi:metallopeptidase [Podospora aff. communis PSN243]|uniref:Metallopeptidase n=1 Tax=Podospora aff. communis PSN243 TaxID=3040156 RepID=A0AAV9GS59_9PEZI|nr:metallopeptidase [Podospora aff. communis PSN243]